MKAYRLLVVVVAVMFALAPWLIARAPYESTMGLVQKIFYFHVPAGLVMFLAAFVCGLASIRYLWTRRRTADHVAVAAAELVLLFGVIVLLSGPLWARKAWGVWWQWDAKLTSALVLFLVLQAYLLLRRFGGPGSERLAAVVGLFGMANVPFVYWSVNIWRTVHPLTTVVPSLPPPLAVPLWWSTVAFQGLFVLLMLLRTRLERRRAELESLYLAVEEQT
jgi:heme exporter protein C